MVLVAHITADRPVLMKLVDGTLPGVRGDGQRFAMIVYITVSLDTKQEYFLLTRQCLPLVVLVDPFWLA